MKDYLTDRRETSSEAAAVITEHRYQPCPANPLKQNINSLVYQNPLWVLYEQNSPVWNNTAQY